MDLGYYTTEGEGWTIVCRGSYPDPMAGHTFTQILGTLNEAKVRYLIAGGMAVLLHGVPRNTHDLDLYIDLAKANLLKALRALGRIGLHPRIPATLDQIADAPTRARWIREKNMLVLQVMDPDDPFHPVDIFVHHLVPFAAAWKRRVVGDLEGVKAPLMSIRDLITLKKAANRAQDVSDIAGLRMVAHEASKKRRT